MTTRILKVLATISLILSLGAAPAFSTILYEFTGEITDDLGIPNPFGLSLGDAINGNTIFPDDVIFGDPAPGEDYDLASVGATLTFNVGPLVLTEADDPFARAFFTDGLLTGFEYEAFFGFGGVDYEFFMSGSFEGETAFSIFDEEGSEVLLGNFIDLQDGAPGVAQAPDPVPEPGTMLLLGTGLFGLLGVRRKCRKK